MQLVALTLNFRTAPVSLRERVATASEQPCVLPQVLAESAVLSTCNRTEIYGRATEPDAVREALIDWLARGDQALRAELAPRVQLFWHEAAARHVFRVASGLESMVVGEPQILGQMKSAARNATEAGTLGPLLHQLFQRAFAAAKEVRSSTAVGRGAVSYGAALVELVQAHVADLRRCRLLFIGAGAMVEKIAPHFAAHHVGEIVLANRTPERAERVAGRCAAGTLTLAELDSHLERFDIVVSCTGSMQPVVGASMLQRSQAARGGKPVLLVDLGVPRDIEPSVEKLPGVTLHTIDDLGARVQSRNALRADAAAQAERIIDEHVERFSQWMTLRPSVPLLRRLNDQVERLRNDELDRARRIVAQGHSVDEALCSLATGLANKLLHAPRTLLHRSNAPGEAQRFLDEWITTLEGGRS